MPGSEHARAVERSIREIWPKMSASEKSRWLIIPIEIQAREFESRFLLAAAAASRGYQVVIGEQSAVHRNLALLPRGILFEKSISINREKHLKHATELGFTIAVTDEESALIYSDPNLFLSGRLNQSTLDFTHVFLCWSDLQRNLCAAEFPRYSSRFITTGSCRADIWRPEFRAVFRDEVESLRRRFGRYILFCSNFSIVNHHAGPDNYLRSFEERGRFERPEVREHVLGLVEDRQRNFAAYVSLLPEVHRWFPEHTLILRPHPVENIDFWRRATRGLRRWHVVKEGSPTAWILGSEAMFHHGCTTGVEASLLGKPHIIYAPHPDRVQDNETSVKVGRVAKDQVSLRQMLKQAVEEGQGELDDCAPVSKYFDALDGPFAFQKVLDVLDGVPLELSRPTEELIRGRFNEASKETAWGAARRWLQGKRPRDADLKAKWQGLSIGQVESLMRQYQGICSEIGPIRVRHKHPRMFEIQAEQTNSAQEFGLRRNTRRLLVEGM